MTNLSYINNIACRKSYDYRNFITIEMSNTKTFQKWFNINSEKKKNLNIYINRTRI